MDLLQVDNVLRKLASEAQAVYNAEAAMYKAKGALLLKGAKIAYDLCPALIGINISAKRGEDGVIGGATMLFISDDTYHLFGPTANVGDQADEEIDVYAFEVARDVLYATGWGNLSQADFTAIFKLYEEENVVFDRQFEQTEHQEFCRIHKVGSWAD